MTDTIALRVTFLRTREHDWTFGLSDTTQVRLITTTAMATSAAVLWLGAAGLLPGAEIGPKVLVASLEPFAVGFVTLMFAEWRAKRDLCKAQPKDYGSALSEGDRRTVSR